MEVPVRLVDPDTRVPGRKRRALDSRREVRVVDLLLREPGTCRAQQCKKERLDRLRH
jgi:hypothetical protein